MPTVNIDNKLYELSKLSDDARAKLESVRFCDQKIQQLEAELAVARTARSAYLQSLTSLLDDSALVATKENSVAKKAPAKKAAAKKAPAKKAPAKKAAAKKAPAKKAAAKKVH